MATQLEPEFAEVEEAFDLKKHLEPVGFFDGIDVFILRDPIDEETRYGAGAEHVYRKTWYAGLYWLDDDDGWCRVPMSYEAKERRDAVRDARLRAAELANNHPATADEFTAKAEAIRAFLIKE